MASLVTDEFILSRVKHWMPTCTATSVLTGQYTLYSPFQMIKTDSFSGYTSNRPDTLKTHRRAPGACVKHTRKLAKEAREEEQKAKGGKGKGKNVQAPIRGL